ncbi:hypothetical protein MKJ04_03055 [Pontibacter sp. E15-1]|uniref:hypothetical protein n=1 Tax=Pontibacter sp. E15-1 TaxID=2919918 RepID=UPI001F4FDE36|nr:hypothetical protein [Pontibacter sp. E15-1]MCJ8163804.1 hypothetical protein [Pontibacter sp. E15-1]
MVDRISAGEWQIPDRQRLYRTFVRATGKGIRSKLGDLPIDYYSGKQIDMVSPEIDPYLDAKTRNKERDFKMREYYDRFRKKNRKSHRYLVTVYAEFLKLPIWENQENVKFRLKVKIKENGEGEVFSEKERYTYYLQNPDSLQQDQNPQSFAIYQNFPLNKDEVQQAYLNGLEQIFFGKVTPKKQYVYRSAYDGYNDFIDRAERKYSLSVPVTYGYATLSNAKYSILGVNVMAGKSKHSAMVAGELSESLRGLVFMSENRFSGLADMDITLPSGSGYRQFTRTLSLSSELFPTPYKNYTLKGFIQEATTLGFTIRHTYANTFKLDLYDEYRELKSDLLFYDLGVDGLDERTETHGRGVAMGPIAYNKFEGSRSLQKILRNYGRIYTPYIKTEGKMLGKQFAMITNPECMNNVEIYYDDEMVGLITHAKPTKKQLKKKKNFIPHMLYLAGGLTAEEEALILQNFQSMRVGYAMNSLQRTDKMK